MFSVFTLEVVMDGYTEDSNSSRRNTHPSTLVATATSIKISREQHSDARSQQFLAVLVPHSMVEASLRRTVYDRKASNNSKRCSSSAGTTTTSSSSRHSKCRWLEQADRSRLSRDLLPRIHPIFTSANNNTSENTTTITSNSLISWNILGSPLQPSQPSNQNNQSSIMIRAIFSTTDMAHDSASDVVLLDIPSSSSSSAAANHRKNNNYLSPSELLQATNGDGMVDAPDHILKMLIVSQVHIASSPMNLLASVASLEIPLCPVCLHRIDPVRLGLPKPNNHHLCSKFCPTLDHVMDTTASAAASLSTDTSSAATTMTSGCPKQRFLRSWPEPSHCIACKVIHDYQTVGSATHNMSPVYCNQCALQKTLWVCLTCGFCGCGRYSNKHAEAHFLDTGHNYSLELATLRIWDYANGEFAHRGDLLDCPSGRQQRARALQLQQQMLASLGDTASVGDAMVGPSAMGGAGGGAGGESEIFNINSATWEQQQPYYWHDQGGDEKSPKKAIMIGEEYEALLQSALEDQAQHYQGEISRLRAVLTAEQVDMDSLTKEEAEVIEKLKSEIADLRGEMDMVGRDLLDVQAQEAGHRADSQRLLREQQVAQDLLKKIHEESKRERELYRQQMDELEQQIADLTGNLRMRHQFSQNEELSNAQIFGTMTSPDPGRGNSTKSKLRRLFRK